MDVRWNRYLVSVVDFYVYKMLHVCVVVYYE